MERLKIPTGAVLLEPYALLKDKLGLVSGDAVIDLGCGNAGHFTLQAAKIVGSEGLVHGVDIIKNSLTSLGHRIQSEGLTNIQLHWSDISTYGGLNIYDNSLDAALLINVLYQNNDVFSVLNETKRMLKPHGKMLVIDWMPGRFPIGPETHVKINPEHIRKHARDLELLEHDFFDAGDYHFGYVFVK